MADDYQTLADMLLSQEGLTEKQKQILVAATEIFAEKGFAASSTSEIAKRAGVAEGTIFRHYKTKKELLLTIVSPMMVKVIRPVVLRDLNKVLDQKYDHFEDFLRAMIENRNEFIQKNKAVIKILLQEIPFHPELKEQFIEQIGKKVISRYRETVLYFQSKGQIVEMEPDAVIRFVGSTVLGFMATKHVFSPRDWDDQKEIERMMEFLRNGLSPKDKEV